MTTAQSYSIKLATLDDRVSLPENVRIVVTEGHAHNLHALCTRFELRKYHLAQLVVGSPESTPMGGDAGRSRVKE